MIGIKLALFKELSFSKQKSQFSERTIRTTFVRKEQSNSTPIVSHLGAIKVRIITRAWYGMEWNENFGMEYGRC